MERVSSQTLKQKIFNISENAARVFDDTGLDESDIITLTRQDLNELLPGPQNFKTRRRISEEIDSWKQRNALKESPTSSKSELERLSNLASNEETRTLTSEVMEDCLHILRATEVQLQASLDFVRERVDALESLQARQMHEESSLNARASEDPLHPPQNETIACESSVFPVRVHSLVCGKTLGYHEDVLRRVGVPFLDVSLDQCQLVLVFCPVISRAGTDIQAALDRVPCEKEVILVVMHYSYSPHLPSTITPGMYSRGNVKEVAHVLFHDSNGGLLNCEPNRKAILLIDEVLKKYMMPNQ